MIEIEEKLLEEYILNGEIKLGRGNIISSNDVFNNPGIYPIYSSSAKGNGEFGKYGSYMFDEELITWSVDGGGRFFHRPKHKFSVTNVSGFMRVDASKWNLRYVYYSLDLQHRNISFDYQTKAHPSVIRKLYTLNSLNLAEQNKIAKIISTLDQAIEQTEAIIAKQQRIKTGLMQDLLTKGIDENGNIRTEATHKFKDSPLGRIPVEWKLKLMGDVVDIIDPNPSHRYPQSTDSGVPIVSTENFVGVNDYDLSQAEKVPIEVFEQQFTRCDFYQEDVIFARKGRLGLARPYGSEKKVFSHTVVVLKPRDTSIRYRFILWLVRFRKFFEEIDKRMNSNSGVPTLGVGFIQAIPIAIPLPDEQQRIVLVVDNADLSISREICKLSKLKRVKIGLMHDLLTGKVRVTDIQNPILTSESL